MGTWDDDFGVATNAAGALIATLVLYLPAAFCAGLVWRLVTWVRDRR